jgi:phosphatidylserine/phosphatidylglycerophosphate/cardiolipin synthase-like enzyme
MKRLASVATLLFSLNLMSMSTLFQSAKRVGSRPLRTPYNSSTFGKTHFIRGYSTPAQSPATVPKKEEIVLDQRPFIIDGSSTHLIDESRDAQSFFSSVHDITSIIVRVIDTATAILEIAAFTFTHPEIADAVIAARKKGVDVSVIMDAAKMQDPYSKAQKLIDNDISVWQYDPSLRPNYKKKNGYDPLMHHKSILVDNNLVVTGSSNLTKSAQKDNIENINLLRDPQTIKEHREEMKRLKSYCKECKKDVAAKA